MPVYSQINPAKFKKTYFPLSVYRVSASLTKAMGYNSHKAEYIKSGQVSNMLFILIISLLQKTKGRHFRLKRKILHHWVRSVIISCFKLLIFYRSEVSIKMVLKKWLRYIN